MPTRRDLLFGLSATTLGILTARFESRFFKAGTARLGFPAPTILGVEEGYDCFYLHHGDPYELPDVTWREYVLWNEDSTDIEEVLADYIACHGPLPGDLDDLVQDVDQVIAVTGRYSTSNGRAFGLLERLPLGPKIREDGEECHFIEFIDGGCPGNDYLGVRVPDVESLALLQRRLDELETGILLDRV